MSETKMYHDVPSGTYAYVPATVIVLLGLKWARYRVQNISNNI